MKLFFRYMRDAIENFLVHLFLAFKELFVNIGKAFYHPKSKQKKPYFNGERARAAYGGKQYHDSAFARCVNVNGAYPTFVDQNGEQPKKKRKHRGGRRHRGGRKHRRHNNNQ